jgi:ubiquinone/menaquinone biosynthesis C-methylase UbiE
VREEIKSYYDRFSPDYDKDRTRRYFNFVNSMETELVRNYCKDKEVLEIGCGTGLILKEIRKTTSFDVGIDLSREMLKISNSKGLRVIQGDVVALPFEDECFDITFSFKVLSHVPEIKKAIEEIARVTKKGGVLILEFYNPFSFKFLINKAFSSHVYQNFYSYWELKKMIPSNLKLESFKGIRIFILFGFLLKVPVLSRVLIFLERKLCKTKFGLFGGYFNIVLRKKNTKIDFI